MRRRPDGKRYLGRVRTVLFISVAAALGIGMNLVLLAYAANPDEPIGTLNPRVARHDGNTPQAAAPSDGGETVTAELTTKDPRGQVGHGSATSGRPGDRADVIAASTTKISVPEAPPTIEQPEPARADDRAATTQAPSSPAPAGAGEPSVERKEPANAKQRRTQELERQSRELEKQKKALEKELEKAQREQDRAGEKELREREKALERELRDQKKALEQAEREREKAERERQREQRLTGADDDD